MVSPLASFDISNTDILLLSLVTSVTLIFAFCPGISRWMVLLLFMRLLPPPVTLPTPAVFSNPTKSRAIIGSKAFSPAADTGVLLLSISLPRAALIAFWKSASNTTVLFCPILPEVSTKESAPESVTVAWITASEPSWSFIWSFIFWRISPIVELLLKKSSKSL